MSKAARLRQERRRVHTPKPPTRAGRRSPNSRNLKVVWIATGGLAVAVAVVVAVLLATSSSPKTAAAATATEADRNALPSLVKAADAVGFHPTTEPGVGEIEGEPASASQPPSNPGLLPVAAVAPNFTLRTPAGRSISLAQYRGKAVLLEFFATWCPHCNAEAPHLRVLAQKFGSRVNFVSVNADSENAASVFAFHRYFGLPYPALVDRSGTPGGSYHSPGGLGHWANVYGVRAYPTFYVIGADGRVMWADDGEQPDILLQQLLQRAIARA
jgi:peroxiredoxin